MSKVIVCSGVFDTAIDFAKALDATEYRGSADRCPVCACYVPSEAHTPQCMVRQAKDFLESNGIHIVEGWNGPEFYKLNEEEE